MIVEVWLMNFRSDVIEMINEKVCNNCEINQCAGGKISEPAIKNNYFEKYQKSLRT